MLPRKWINVAGCLFVFSALAVTRVTTFQMSALLTSLGMMESTPFPIRKPPEVHFLNSTHIADITDFFSATWIQPISSFLKLNTKRIENLEGGSFAVFRQNIDSLRMTVDWLDLSVEHMSKWWKVLNVFHDDIPYNLTISSFQSYIRNIRINEKDSTMIDTIAVVAFEPWKSRENPDNKGNTLSIFSLAATMASLLQAGFGRVVVVGHTKEAEKIVQRAFRLLHDTAGADTRKATPSSKADMPIFKIGFMEVGYARATTKEIESKFLKNNLVKGALAGLHSALNGDLDEERQETFLGDGRNATSWKYVYFTEPDLILHTRPSALGQLRDALNEGLVLCPHRLQPLPHESDVPLMKNQKNVVPATGNFLAVTKLNPFEGSVCCDAGPIKPWEAFGSCGDFWWKCGFKGKRNHSRLDSYPLMRLHPGMGIVSIAGSEHGRRCWPSTSGTCVPP